MCSPFDARQRKERNRMLDNGKKNFKVTSVGIRHQNTHFHLDGCQTEWHALEIRLVGENIHRERVGREKKGIFQLSLFSSNWIFHWVCFVARAKHSTTQITFGSQSTECEECDVNRCWFWADDSTSSKRWNLFILDYIWLMSAIDGADSSPSIVIKVRWIFFCHVVLFSFCDN